MEQEDLYRKLAERIFMHGSKLIPELFRMIADEEEARLLLATPGTAEQLAERTGKDVEQVEEMLATLFRKGLVFKSRKPEGTVYRMCRDLVQFHDASILWPEAPREYHDLWKRYMEEEWPEEELEEEEEEEDWGAEEEEWEEEDIEEEEWDEEDIEEEE